MGAAAILSSRAIRGMFYKRLEEATRASWVGRIGNEFTTDQGSEDYNFLGQVPALKEWIGARRKKEPTGYGITIKSKKFEASVEFSVDDLRRDKTPQVRARIRDLATRAAVLPQKLFTDLLTTNGNGYDGVAFFGDRSALTTGGQINNDRDGTSDAAILDITTPTAPTSADMSAAILLGVKTLLSALDDEGEPENAMAQRFVVMVPINLWDVAVAARTNEFTSAGVSNTMRAILERGLSIDLVVNPRLTNGAQFYVFREDSEVRSLIWQDEVSADLDELAEGSDYEFFNDAHVYGVKRIGNGGYGMPEMACRLTFT